MQPEAYEYNSVLSLIMYRYAIHSDDVNQYRNDIKMSVLKV